MYGSSNMLYFLKNVSFFFLSFFELHLFAPNSLIQQRLFILHVTEIHAINMESTILQRCKGFDDNVHHMCNNSGH